MECLLQALLFKSLDTVEYCCDDWSIAEICGMAHKMQYISAEGHKTTGSTVSVDTPDHGYATNRKMHFYTDVLVGMPFATCVKRTVKLHAHPPADYDFETEYRRLRMGVCIKIGHYGVHCLE